MYFLFDTETTGFPSKDLPSHHPAQAHICQIAMLQLDNEFKEIDSYCTLVKPEGKWRISEGAFKVHGISNEKCESLGIPFSLIIDRYGKCYEACKYIAGHNIQFDNQMLKIEHDCFNVPWRIDRRPLCTMELMTPIMKLPHARRNAFGSSYKWPKLQEAFSFVTQGKESLQGAHDALVDIRATARILQWLFANKYITL